MNARVRRGRRRAGNKSLAGECAWSGAEGVAEFARPVRVLSPAAGLDSGPEDEEPLGAAAVSEVPAPLRGLRFSPSSLGSGFTFCQCPLTLSAAARGHTAQGWDTGL